MYVTILQLRVQVRLLEPRPQIRRLLVGDPRHEGPHPDLVLGGLLDLLPDAHLELSRYENLGAVEALIAAYGAQRFLYGSFYPRLAMGPMLYYLHHIGLDDDALRAVCSGNLQRLLGEQS